LPLIRSQEAESQLLIDILKWNIIDAADMSALRRSVGRLFAKADPAYKESVPAEILM
jgi:hypothetical protein